VAIADLGYSGPAPINLLTVSPSGPTYNETLYSGSIVSACIVDVDETVSSGPSYLAIVKKNHRNKLDKSES
jgi:hypothetical protein